MQANMEKPMNVVVASVDGIMSTHNNNLSFSSLMSSICLMQYQCNRVQPYDIVDDQDNSKQKQYQSIDPHHLVLGKVIDRGSYSVVHKGSYHGQTVAVKVMDFGDEGLTKERMESKKDHFIRKVGIWQNLDHPNITKMIGETVSLKTSSNGRMNNMTRNESNFCIVSEYVEGGTLEYYLSKKRNKKLPMKTVVGFALDLAKGLSYLHSKKIVHRDVKPRNILIDKLNTLKLADFGESCFEEDIFWDGHEQEPGTRHYTAPEVVKKIKCGHKCDVYSFGICLWEIYCCERAHRPGFAHNLTPELYDHTKPSRLLNCPMWLTRLMEKCWDSDPRKRPEMKEVVVQLEEIVKSEGWQSTTSEDQQDAYGCFGSYMHGR